MSVVSSGDSRRERPGPDRNAPVHANPPSENRSCSTATSPSGLHAEPPWFVCNDTTRSRSPCLHGQETYAASAGGCAPSPGRKTARSEIAAQAMTRRSKSQTRTGRTAPTIECSSTRERFTVFRLSLIRNPRRGTVHHLIEPTTIFFHRRARTASRMACQRRVAVINPIPPMSICSVCFFHRHSHRYEQSADNTTTARRRGMPLRGDYAAPAPHISLRERAQCRK